MGESRGLMQERLLEEIHTAQQRDAAEFVCGVERQNERLHWVRSYPLVTMYTLPYEFIP